MQGSWGAICPLIPEPEGWYIPQAGRRTDLGPVPICMWPLGTLPGFFCWRGGFSEGGSTPPWVGGSHGCVGMTQEFGLVCLEIKGLWGLLNAPTPIILVRKRMPAGRKRHCLAPKATYDTVVCQRVQWCVSWVLASSFLTTLPGGTAGGCILGQGTQTEGAGALGWGSPEAAPRWNAS